MANDFQNLDDAVNDMPKEARDEMKKFAIHKLADQIEGIIGVLTDGAPIDVVMIALSGGRH